jgi:hypothetical protein
VLRAVIPSYLRQVEKALWRGDLVSVNHRLAALLASYFDIVFAYNRVLHPGEKRLVEQAGRLCPRLPVDMVDDVHAALRAAGDGSPDLLARLNRLLDRLDALLKDEFPGLAG